MRININNYIFCWGIQNIKDTSISIDIRQQDIAMRILEKKEPPNMSDVISYAKDKLNLQGSINLKNIIEKILADKISKKLCHEEMFGGDPSDWFVSLYLHESWPEMYS